MFSRIVGFTWQVGGSLQMIPLFVGSEMRLDLEGRGGDKDALTARWRFDGLWICDMD